MRDARGSAVAALTWVLWKGRNRLKKIGSYQSKFFGPNFVPNVLKKIGERLRAGSEIFATSDFFGKKSASLIRPLAVTTAVRSGLLKVGLPVLDRTDDILVKITQIIVTGRHYKILRG